MKNLSIIVPCYNEEGNIQFLIERIDRAMKINNIIYEIIFIDDHSTDWTYRELVELSLIYPQILFFDKNGQKGKAFSILEGVTYAHFETIVIIDADLQYPPESIPMLLEKLKSGVDVVIANRIKKGVSYYRRFIGELYSVYFAYLLHGLAVDVQSGLMLFKKEIISRITINPTPWTFNLEFLLKARNAGYKIDQVDVVLGKRNWGTQKGRFMNSVLEIGLRTLYLKLKSLDPVPFLPEMEQKEGAGFHYKGDKFIHHSILHYSETAFYRLSKSQKVFLLVTLLIISIGLIFNWHTTLIYIIALLTFLYFVDLLFNLSLVYRSFAKDPDIKVSDDEIKMITNWPTYTILCPLYKEYRVLPQFVTAISKIDYPKDKLQVLLIFEEDDVKTIDCASQYKLPSYFKIIIVPCSYPKTKPKALNYAVKFAIGKFIVVYDAEDVPDSLQLKKAVVAFTKVKENVVCIQAKLNFYNPHQNLITRVFTAEYSLWFDLILTGLQSIHAPIPLGGTSNHFKTKDLIAIKCWDSFNVTEDCDLGMRLVKHGYKTEIFDSVTLEEANSGMMNWFRQRTRWAKGYVQTYFLHMRRPKDFIKNWREFDLITFQLIIGGKILSMLINPVMWIITIAYFAFRAHIGLFIESFFPTPILYMGVLSLALGNFLYMYYYMIGTARHGHHELVKYTFLVPFYWLAMSLAAYVSLFKFVIDPYYWAKTKHGLYLGNNKVVKYVNTLIGRNSIDQNLEENKNINTIQFLLNKLFNNGKMKIKT